LWINILLVIIRDLLLFSQLSTTIDTLTQFQSLDDGKHFYNIAKNPDL